MKDEPQIFTRTDIQGSPVEADILDTLEGIGMTEELLRTYIQGAFALQDTFERIGDDASLSLLTTAPPQVSSFPPHIFDESYVIGVLGIQIPLNESYPFSAELQNRIIEEQLLLEGWFDGFKKLGGDMKNLGLAIRYMFEDGGRIKEFVSTTFDTVIKEPMAKIVEFIKKVVGAVTEWFKKFEFPKLTAIWEKTKEFLTALQEKLQKGWEKIKGMSGWKQALAVMAFGAGVGYLWIEQGLGDIIEAVGKKVDQANEVVKKWAGKLADYFKKNDGPVNLMKLTKKNEAYIPPLSVLLYEEDEKLHEFLGGIFGKKNADADEMGLELPEGEPAPSDGVLVSPEQAKKAGIKGKSKEEAEKEKEEAGGGEGEEGEESAIGEEVAEAAKEELWDQLKGIFEIFQDKLVALGGDLLKKIGIEAVSGLVTGGVSTFLTGIKSAYGGIKLISDLFGDTLGAFVKKIENPEEEAKEAEAGQNDPTEGGAKTEALIRTYVRNKLIIDGRV